MLRRAEYPMPRYHDPNDRRLLDIVRKAKRPSKNAVNMIGIPFDGAVLGRKGAAGGPAAIRQSLAYFSSFNIDTGSDIGKTKVLDLGDLVIGSSDVRGAQAEIQGKVEESLEPSSLLVIIGGDNSISLPSIRALANRFGEIGLIVIDSHLDLRGEIEGRPTSGSSYGLALQTIPQLDPSRVVEIGAHGFLNSRRYVERAKRKGISIVTAAEVRKLGARRVAEGAYRKASQGADSVYLSVDLDSVDLGSVSGVSAPSAGGISANELLEMVRTIAGKESVRSADLVELAPSLDPTGRSQLIAGTCVAELIGAFESRRKR